MHFPVKFSRWVGGGGTALGSDSKPAVAPNPAADNQLAARVSNVNGWPIQRIAVAFEGPALAPAIPATLYVYDSTTERWFSSGSVNLTSGEIGYFDALGLAETPQIGQRIIENTAGGVVYALVCSDPGGTPAGEYVFALAPDITTSEQSASVLGAVTVTASALPTGAATAAKQDVGNASLASIDGKFPAAAAAADAADNATTMTAVRSRSMVFNGTTWDRIRGSLAGVASAVVATWTGFLHVLGFGRYVSTRPLLTDGQGSHLHLNTRGDLAIQEQYIPDYEDNANDVAWVATRAIVTSIGAWTNYQSGTTKVGAAGLSVKTTAGRVRRMGAGNTGATGLFLVLVNKASAAANPDAVIASKWVPAGQSADIDFGESGIYLDTGIALAMSTYCEKVNLPPGSDCHVWAQYI